MRWHCGNQRVAVGVFYKVELNAGSIFILEKIDSISETGFIQEYMIFDWHVQAEVII